MGAMKELLYDLAELQENGVDITDFKKVHDKAEGVLLAYIESIGPEKWPDYAQALVPAQALVADEDGSVTEIEALERDLRTAYTHAIRAREATAFSNPEISNVLVCIVNEISTSLDFLKQVIKAKDNL